MKIAPLVIGLCIIFVSIIGYFYTPSMISQLVHSVIGIKSSSASSSPVSTTSMLHSMGYPSRSIVVPIMQDSFIGLAIVGIGMIGFGVITKNFKKQFATKPSLDKNKVHKNSEHVDEKPQSSLKILQERLAKGEITSSEFQRLKELLDDHN